MSNQEWYIRERDGVLRQIRPSDKGENAREYWSGHHMSAMNLIATIEIYRESDGEREADVSFVSGLRGTTTSMIHGGEFIRSYLNFDEPKIIEGDMTSRICEDNIYRNHCLNCNSTDTVFDLNEIDSESYQSQHVCNVCGVTSRDPEVKLNADT